MCYVFIRGVLNFKDLRFLICLFLYCKKKLLFFNGIVFRREFLNLLGNFVVKVEDIKEKLKLYVGGGFIFCERGRFINFGRRVVNDYFEKFFVNVFVLRIILVLLKVKKRKVRCIV